MKIAVIGSGISGLTCAHYLDKLHDVTLFEANDYFGGHTATKNVVCEGKTYAIDTGFIVFNDRNYRHFRQLMRELGIGEQKTEMSFSVKNPETGLEYNGNHLWSLFAQKRNLINPKFYAFLLEILRFNKAARHAYAISLNGHPMVEQTLGDFLFQSSIQPLFLPELYFADGGCDLVLDPIGYARVSIQVLFEIFLQSRTFRHTKSPAMVCDPSRLP